MSAVEAVVAAGGIEARNVMDRVEERMRDLAAGHGALLARYAGETISAGGKLTLSPSRSRGVHRQPTTFTTSSVSP